MAIKTTSFENKIKILAQLQEAKVPPYAEHIPAEWVDFLVQHYLGISLAFFFQNKVVASIDPVTDSFINGAFDALLEFKYGLGIDEGYESLWEILGDED